MHIFLVLSVTFCVVSVAVAGLCDPVTIKYTIGTLTSVMDVLAEDISQMRQPCHKDIIIPGAKESWFKVVQAEFGYNRAYEYSGLIGTSRRPIYDQILLHFGKCSTMTKTIKVTTGLSKKFTSRSICLYINPEIDHRALGTDVPGGRIKLSVRVETAVCPASLIRIDTNIHGSCQPLCNGSGVLHNCEKVQANTSPAVTTEPTMATEMQSFTYFLSSKKHTSILSTIPQHTIGADTSVAPVQISTLATKIKTPSKSTITMQYKPTKTTMINTSKNYLSTSASKTDVKVQKNSSETTKVQDVKPITTLTTTLKTSRNNLSTPSRTDMTFPINTSKLLIAQKITTSRTLVIAPSTKTVENFTTPSSGENEQLGEGNHIFGLLEGLYVIAGCIVLLLFLGILAFIVRKRNIYSSSGSKVGSTHRDGVHWRDNWLVRYHNNEIEGDSISQLDSDIHFIHGNFLNQSNTELHHIHHSGYAEIIKNKSGDDSYDDPWPLVRLDADFVKNARSLERERSHADTNDVNNEEHGIREITAHSRNEEDKRDSESNGNSKKNENFCDSAKAYQNKHHFHRQVGSPMTSRGKYDIEKVERSNSKSSYKNSQRLSDVRRDINHRDHKRTQPESHMNHVESKKKDSRQRNSSSMCSECSPTFEEMLTDEVHYIEDALDMNCNVDTESSGSDRDVKKNWKVSTLYAIVSSRNGVSPKDIVVTRKPSHKRQNSEVNRSESYRKIDDAETKTKVILRSTSRTKSLHRDRNLTDRCQKGTCLQEVLGNDSKMGARQTEGKTVNGSGYAAIRFQEGRPMSDSPDTAEKNDPNETKNCDESLCTKNKLESIKNVCEALSTFQQNREKFEQNGSIKQESRPNSGASGTGQFPK